MAITTLSLPIDIPWRRLAVSEDMYAPSEDGPLPIKWHTSLAVFFFEPEPDPTLSNPDEVTTFLKVVATVSGFQPQGDEIDTAALTGSSFSTLIIQNYDKLTNQYYPCLSALLQVAVFPSGGSFAIGQFPYLTDFEPKKREIVELVSDKTTRQTGGYLDGIGPRLAAAFLERGLLLRPLGNLVYFMPPYVITEDEVDWAIQQIGEVLGSSS